jgi:hypothetical protein
MDDAIAFPLSPTTNARRMESRRAGPVALRDAKVAASFGTVAVMDAIALVRITIAATQVPLRMDVVNQEVLARASGVPSGPGADDRRRRDERHREPSDGRYCLASKARGDISDVRANGRTSRNVEIAMLARSRELARQKGIGRNARDAACFAPNSRLPVAVRSVLPRRLRG